MSEPVNLENIICYGQPADCRGWRQFLVERNYCKLRRRPPDGLLPCAIWVGVELIRHACGHKGYAVHPDSARAVCESVGRPYFDNMEYPICEKQGRFID